MLLDSEDEYQELVMDNVVQKLTIVYLSTETKFFSRARIFREFSKSLFIANISHRKPILCL